MIKYAFCSYSFNRMLKAGQQDIFQHIKDVKKLGACQIDPWNGHLATIFQNDRQVPLNAGPAEHGILSQAEKDYLQQVKDAAQAVGLPWGCLAADGAHIYDENEAVRKKNRAVACRWLAAAAFLGAAHLRVDAGGPADLPGPVLKVIAAGYADLIKRAADVGVRIIVENHWGPSVYPDNIIKLLESIPGLGYLFDTNNWAAGLRDQGWERCAKLALVTHFKTFAFDQDGWETSADLKRAVRILLDSGYHGVWGIESCPRDGDEMEGARKTVALLTMALGEK
jgi:sugar phosphate isomerase/epimerase